MLKYMTSLKTKQTIPHTWKSRSFKEYLLISTRPLRTNTKKRCPCQPSGVECKTRSQEIPGVTGKFDLGVQNEAGQRLTAFCQENALIIENTLFQQHRDDSTHGHHQMVNTKIRLIIFFVAKDREVLYSQ